MVKFHKLYDKSKDFQIVLHLGQDHMRLNLQGVLLYSVPTSWRQLAEILSSICTYPKYLFIFNPYV